MPTSNQSTDTAIVAAIAAAAASASAIDTNNNSSNKITNGARTETLTVATNNDSTSQNQNNRSFRQSPLHLIPDGGYSGPTSTIMPLQDNRHSVSVVVPNNSNNNQSPQEATIIPASIMKHDLQPQQRIQQQQQLPQLPQHNHQLSSAYQNNNITITNNNNNNIVANGDIITFQQQQHSMRQQSGSPARGIKELVELIRDFNFDRTSLSNAELIRLVKHQQISVYKLESFLGKDNAARCVEVRRDYYRLELAELDKTDLRGIRDRADAFAKPNYEDLEYEKVNGACCENVIGHVKVPVGVAGPLVLDGEEIFVPLATTEGCLVASTCRGLSALRKSGGVSSRVRRDFMTRAPIVRFQDAHLRDALDNVERAIAWLNDEDNKRKMSTAFNLTSSHGKFLNYTMYPVNREIHIRFEAQTGDAMGMNMCSKGVESALKEMQRAFPSMEIVTLSGNMCTDKKAAGINWINGRGKSVECNAELPANVVQQVFKVSVDSMIDRWKSKVMVGSALAASIGGFNSQAANILTAIFIATGQDPAQNVTSSNCMLILEKDSKGSLVVCCTMPSIECGTVGGGTILGDQSRYLQMMGVKGPTPKQALGMPAYIGYNVRQGDSAPGAGLHSNNSVNSITNNHQPPPLIRSPKTENSSTKQASTSTVAPFALASGQCPVNKTNSYTNARKLARITCATVMAAELSLLAALTEGTLVKSHMRHNRSSTNVTSADYTST